MKLGGVRALFRARLNSLGYTEHSDGFAFNNIPATLVDGAYHLEVGQITSGPPSHQPYSFKMPINLRIFGKGFADPSRKIDEMLDGASDIYADLLAPAVRLNPINTAVKDFRPLTLTIQPIAQSNDNAIIMEMPFEVYLIYYFS